MEPKKEALALAAMSAVAVLLFLGGLVWVFAGGIGLSIDSIFLILVCLAMAGLFSFMMLWQMKIAGLLPPLKWPRQQKAAPAAAESAQQEVK
jgi:hypothetical protein